MKENSKFDFDDRDSLGSRLGFILLSAGCAIGCGNVWKFPWLAGQYGGGAFVLLYILFLILLGWPIMTMEFSVGRASQRSPVRMYKVLEPAGTKWHYHGYIALAGNFCLMMFYTIVTGWMLHYFTASVFGEFAGMNPQQVGASFGKLLGDPEALLMNMALVVIAGFAILSFSLRGGLERVTKWMMLALMVIMMVLAINALFMNGASEGLKFYLLPNFGKIDWSVAVAAMNQAFFTLSIGIGSMAIFGSYIGKTHRLGGEAANVIALDTFVAIVAGLIIFPACFTYGVQPNAGPGLIFVTLPNIFNHMPSGRVWGPLFFIFMTFACFSTVLAVFENILACMRELTGWSRRKTAWISCVAMLILSTPCALGFNLWSGIQPMGQGTCIMDLEDFIVSNCLLPLGGLIFVFFCTFKRGWGWENFIAEANTGVGMRFRNGLRLYCTFVLPLIILVVFIAGILPFFK